MLSDLPAPTLQKPWGFGLPLSFTKAMWGWSEKYKVAGHQHVSEPTIDCSTHQQWYWKGDHQSTFGWCKQHHTSPSLPQSSSILCSLPQHPLHSLCLPSSPLSPAQIDYSSLSLCITILTCFNIDYSSSKLCDSHLPDLTIRHHGCGC